MPTSSLPGTRRWRPCWQPWRGGEAGELSGAANTAWLGMVIAGLLMTAVQAAAAGLIDPSEAGDLVADAFIDGFGTS
jgi:hypothetical protein